MTRSDGYSLAAENAELREQLAEANKTISRLERKIRQLEQQHDPRCKLERAISRERRRRRREAS